MGVFAESNAVGGIVVAAAGKLVDVAGIDDGAGVERNQPVTGHGTGIISYLNGFANMLAAFFDGLQRRSGPNRLRLNKAGSRENERVPYGG